VSRPLVQASGIRAGASVDLALEAGKLMVVTGPSLSGKTTLVEQLAGWVRPPRGTVSWVESNGSPPGWSYLTVVPQALALLEELSVVENILLAARFAARGARAGAGRRPDDDRVESLLDRLGLSRLRHRGALEISVGERQRTMVARALVGAPQVVLADEPVAHQDQRNADIVLALLRETATAGAACLIATRNPATAALADRVLTLPQGEAPG
jgi:putative ABC transport system ATP-binding protein